MFSYPGSQDPPICGGLTKSRDDDRITCVLYSSQHKASSFGVIRQITGIGAYQLCWNQIHGVLSNPVENTNTKKYENMVSTQLWHTRNGLIIESLLVLQSSSDPLSSFNIGRDCNFGDKKSWCDLPVHLCQYSLSTSYHQEPLPHGQHHGHSLLNRNLWRTFKLGKPPPAWWAWQWQLWHESPNLRRPLKESSLAGQVLRIIIDQTPLFPIITMAWWWWRLSCGHLILAPQRGFLLFVTL